MSADEKKPEQVKGKIGLGYEEMVWIKDKEGREYACQFSDIKVIKRKEETPLL